MYARFIIFLSLYLFLPLAALAETTLGEAKDLPLGDGQFVSTEAYGAGVFAIVSVLASLITMGIKSKGWPAWLQIVVDALNTLALNVWKNKNADSVEK